MRGGSSYSFASWLDATDEQPPQATPGAQELPQHVPFLCHFGNPESPKLAMLLLSKPGSEAMQMWAETGFQALAMLFGAGEVYEEGLQ